MTMTRRLVFGGLAGILAAALVVATAPSSRAESTSTSVQVSCSFTNPPAFNPDNAYGSTIVISGPDSVAPGEQFTITVDANPMQNGPVPVQNPGEAVISVHATVAGDAQNTGSRESATWSNPAPLAPNEQYNISPRPISVTAGQSEGTITVQFDLIELFATTINTSLWCGAFTGDSAVNPTLSIPVVAPATTTTSEATTSTSTDTTTSSVPDTSSTTSSAPTTTVPETTTSTAGGTTSTSLDPTSTTVGDTSTSTLDGTTSSTTVEETTTSTIPKADIVSGSARVSYGCTPFVSGSNLGTETATQTITFSAPDRVNPGDEFTVTIKMSPGPESGPIPLAAGTQQFRARFGATGGGSPSTVNVSGGTNRGDIAPNSIISIPAMRGKVTATGSAGESIGFTPGRFTIDSPSLDARTVCEPASTPVVLSTAIVAEPVSLADDGSLPATGLSDYIVPLVIGGFSLYFGLLLVSTLPRKRREETS